MENIIDNLENCLLLSGQINKIMKTKLLLSGVLLLMFSGVFAQALPEIHSQAIALDNQANLLCFGDYHYRFEIFEGNVISAKSNEGQMRQITGSQKETLVNQLLGEKRAEYSDISTLTLWEKDEKYIIFDLHTKVRDNEYKYRFYFKND
jgi:hypothetical protein